MTVISEDYAGKATRTEVENLTDEQLMGWVQLGVPEAINEWRSRRAKRPKRRLRPEVKHYRAVGAVGRRWVGWKGETKVLGRRYIRTAAGAAFFGGNIGDLIAADHPRAAASDAPAKATFTTFTDAELTEMFGRLIEQGEFGDNGVVRVYKTPHMERGTLLVGWVEQDQEVYPYGQFSISSADGLADMLKTMADDAESYTENYDRDDPDSMAELVDDWGDPAELAPGELVHYVIREINGTLWRVGFDKAGDVQVRTGHYDDQRNFIEHDDDTGADFGYADAQQLAEHLETASWELHLVEDGYHNTPEENEDEETEEDEDEEPEGNLMGFVPHESVHLWNPETGAFTLTSAEAEDLIRAADEMHDTDTSEGDTFDFGEGQRLYLEINEDAEVQIWSYAEDRSTNYGTYMEWLDYNEFRDFIERLRANRSMYLPEAKALQQIVQTKVLGAPPRPGRGKASGTDRKDIVRTPAGAAHFNQPIGTVIYRKLTRKELGALVRSLEDRSDLQWDTPPEGDVALTRIATIPETGQRLVRKEFPSDPRAVFREHLASKVGEAVGAPVPMTTVDMGYTDYAFDEDGHPLNEFGERWEPGDPDPEPMKYGPYVWMDYVPGQTAVRAGVVSRGDHAVPEDYLRSHQGLLMGLLDSLIDNSDRHGFNWTVLEDGSIGGYDHGEAFRAVRQDVLDAEGTFRPPQMNHRGFTSRFIGRDQFGNATWVSRNDLHPDDVVLLRERLEKLKTDFERFTMQEHGLAGALMYRAMMRRFEEIASRAHGTERMIQ